MQSSQLSLSRIYGETAVPILHSWVQLVVSCTAPTRIVLEFDDGVVNVHVPVVSGEDLECHRLVHFGQKLVLVARRIGRLADHGDAGYLATPNKTAHGVCIIPCFTVPILLQ